MPSAILFVIGASGAGKTTAIEILNKKENTPFPCYAFDTIGVPNSEEMTQKFGSPDAWQADATARWIQKIANKNDPISILEGQTRPSFIKDALSDFPEIEITIVLLDCSQETRNDRLINLRNQPELATEEMESWAKYLRNKAIEYNIKIIDTSHRSAIDIAEELLDDANALGKKELS